MGVFVAWLLVAVFCAVPLFCWWWTSRDPAARIAVALALAACMVGVLVVFLHWTYLTSPIEAFFSYPIVAVVLIGLGLRYERRRLGAPDRGSRGRTPWVVLSVYLGLALVCGAPMYLLTNTEAGIPDSRPVLPLPDGLRVVDDSRTGCGSGACTRWIVVTGRRDLPPQQVAHRVRDHLRELGWEFGSDQEACRRNGVWFDRTYLCVNVGRDGGHAVIRLTQARGGIGG